MAVALFLIGALAVLAGIVLFVWALVRKRGWGVARSLALGGFGIVLAIIGMVIGIGEEFGEKRGKPDTEVITPAITGSKPETPKENEMGESRLNPVAFGFSLTYGDKRVTVTESERVSKIGFSRADEDSIYLIVNIKIDFLGDPSEKKYYLSTFNFRTAGSSGHIYNAEWYPETDTPLKTGEFYGGATTSGDLVYKINKEDTDLVLIWNCGLGVDRYLEIP